MEAGSRGWKLLRPARPLYPGSGGFGKRGGIVGFSFAALTDAGRFWRESGGASARIYEAAHSCRFASMRESRGSFR